MEVCLKVLTDIQHPFIHTPILASVHSTGLMTIREFVASGSLKDAIYGKDPKGTAITKYSVPAKVRKLSMDKMKQYGRQVLEALNFLAEKGFVLGK